MADRRLIISCNMIITALVETDGDSTHISIEDARHATIGYATGERMEPEFKHAVSRKTLVMSLRALADRIELDPSEAAADEERESMPVLTQKGANA